MTVKSARPAPTWHQLAWIALLKYLLLLRHDLTHPTFTAEMARDFCEHHGLDAPPDERAWGALIERASRRDLIVDTLMRAESRHVSRKRAKVVVWRVA